MPPRLDRLRHSVTLLAVFVIFFVVFFLPAEGTKLMASGDAICESLPALLGNHHLWEPLFWLGYPFFSDPNQQHWYPLAWLVSSLGTFNAFAIAPYVIGAFASAGFVRSLTGSTPSAMTAGFVYALGGFMISHAGHLMITHPAAWAPFVFWAIESFRKSRSPGALAVCSLALGMLGVSGQPTVLAFTLVLAAGYAIASALVLKAKAARFLIPIAIAFAIGVGLGCIELVPEAALAHQSVRAALPFDAFVEFELPASQLALRALFPYAMGGSHSTGFSYSQIDLGGFTEETLAVGSVALVLAFFASTAYARDKRIVFWALVAVAGLLLCVGDATPLARLTYLLPIFNLFRIPGRHAFEFDFAAAVLAGYGTFALRQGLVSWRRFALTVASLATFFGIGFAQFAGGAASNASIVAQTSGTDIVHVTSPIINGALGFPIATAIFGCALIAFAVASPRTKSAAALVLLAVVVDMGGFAWPAYWNWGATDRSSLTVPAFVRALSATLRENDTRVAWLPGYLSAGIAPNLTELWHVPMVGVYSPLIPTRAEDLVGMNDAGGVTLPNPGNTAFDVAGTSLLAAPSVPADLVSYAQPFANGNIHVFFSLHDPTARQHAELALAAPASATSIAMVSELGDSLAIAQGTAVATLSVIHVNGNVERTGIIAGRDTSEFAYDRPDVRASVKHERAHIFATFGSGHEYDATFPIRSRDPIRRIEITWTSPVGAFTIEKLSLLDARSKSAHAFDALAPLFAQPDHWRPRSIDPSIAAFANLDVRPRAWFAQPIVANREQSIRALHDAILPTGGAFDAKRDAVVEDAAPAIGPPAAADLVRLEADTPSDVFFTTTCLRACFLVVRDAYDPNWIATVDGTTTPIHATDLALRGVALASGTHRVRFSFPADFTLHRCRANDFVSACDDRRRRVLTRSRALRAS